MRSVRGGTFGRILALAWLAFTGGRAHAQVPYIVKDLNTSTAPGTVGLSGPWGGFLSSGQRVFMHGFEPSSGNELWSTDGTLAGTGLLADLCPGTCDGSPTILGAIHGVALGRTDPGDLLHPIGPFTPQLWRSDGTPRGTYVLPGAAPGHDSVVAGGYLYYGLDDTGVWRTDGTIAGTQHLDALAPFVTAGVGGLTAFGDRIVFVDNGYYGGHGALVSSDGTAAGTTLLHDFGQSDPLGLTAAGNLLFFVVLPPPLAQSADLWVSDGTVAGTHAVQSFARGVGNFEDPDEETVARFKVAGNHVYFLADDGQHGRQVWVSDGTAKGTLRLSDFAGDAFGTNTCTIGPSQIEEAVGNVVFVANGSFPDCGGGYAPGWQVWASPIAPGHAGPSQVVLCGQDCITATDALAKIGDHVLFSAGGRLLSTDGTPAGTVGLRCGRPCGGVSVAPLLGAGYFAVSASSFEIWRTDGTAAGTRRFAAISGARYTGASEVPFAIGSLGDRRIVFTTDTPLGLWISDGTPAGTFQLAGDGELNASSSPDSFAVVGDRLLFTDHHRVSPAEDDVQLWQTQGTPDSTSVLAGAGGMSVLAVTGDTAYLAFPESLDLWTWDPTRPAPTKVARLPADDDFTKLTSPAAYLGQLYFALGEGFAPATADQHVWKSDGTAAGTGQAFALPAGYIFPANLAPLGRDLYFTSQGPLFGEEVLRSDGTTQGTVPLTQFGNASSRCPPQFTRVGATVFFVGWDAATGLQPWRTDGSAAGTSLVASVAAGDSQSGPVELIEHQGALYFFAVSPSSEDRQVLWRSDGSAAGTVEVADFAFHGAGDECDADPHFLTSTGSLLFFAADDGVHGREPWRSDGTAAGTQMIRDIAPGPAGSTPTGLVAAGGEVFFAADDGLHGIELWRSDGTEAGTRMVADLASGASSSNPGNLAVLGSRLLFAADDGTTGSELWALPLAGAGCAASPALLCVQGNRFAVSVEWEDFAGNAGMGQAVALTGDTGYFWFFDPADVEVIVKVLDGRPLDGDFWVFYGALSSVRYVLTVTDTMTGLSRRYENFAGVLASVADTHAFGPTGAAARRSHAGAEAAASRTAASGTCSADAGHLCLDAGRFAVEASWTDFSGHSGKGQAVTLTGDTGYFWFFDPANVEVVLKVLDGRAVNGKFWVFYGALSNVEYTLKVTDTATGAVKVYTNPKGTLASVADTSAF
jgi:ELWxxDGT repeat protein